MPELKFVLKAFMVTIVIAMLMQIKIGTSTIETHAHLWIETATVPGYLHDVSSGAVAAIRNAAKASTDFVAKSFGHDGNTQKANRLNLGFKRSPSEPPKDE